MNISLPGVLLRAAERCERTRDMPHLGYPLRQLLDHLREVRHNPETLADFMELWVDDEKRPAFEEKQK